MWFAHQVGVVDDVVVNRLLMNLPAKLAIPLEVLVGTIVNLLAPTVEDGNLELVHAKLVVLRNTEIVVQAVAL